MNIRKDGLKVVSNIVSIGLNNDDLVLIIRNLIKSLQDNDIASRLGYSFMLA